MTNVNCRLEVHAIYTTVVTCSCSVNVMVNSKLSRQISCGICIVLSTLIVFVFVEPVVSKLFTGCHVRFMIT